MSRLFVVIVYNIAKVGSWLFKTLLRTLRVAPKVLNLQSSHGSWRSSKAQIRIRSCLESIIKDETAFHTVKVLFTRYKLFLIFLIKSLGTQLKMSTADHPEILSEFYYWQSTPKLNKCVRFGNYCIYEVSVEINEWSIKYDRRNRSNFSRFDVDGYKWRVELGLCVCCILLKSSSQLVYKLSPTLNISTALFCSEQPQFRVL